MDFSKANHNGNFFFVMEGYQVYILVPFAKLITLKLNDTHLNKTFYISAVYAKYDSLQRLHL